MLLIEFDPRKDEANRRKHGLSLSNAQQLDWDGAVILPDDRMDYGEPRFRAYGMMFGRLHMAAFTLRGTAVRMISLRRANERETRRYGRTDPD
jgi:uncharacterized DUF497 family protein